MAFVCPFPAAVCAAKGVLLRDPLKPTLPALDQLTTFPRVSVMLMTVLLKVAWTWAIPWTIFLASFLGPGRGPPRRRSVVMILPLTSSAGPPPSSGAAPCGSLHWWGCAGLPPGGRADG